MPKLKHIFFDLDNTLMLSRTVMVETHQELFKQLCDVKDVIVVSGAQASQIRSQIPLSIGATFYILGQTGNQSIGKDGEIIWLEQFSQKQTDATLRLIELLKAEFSPLVKDPGDLVELRGAQISYSPIGHHETSEKKYAFDPGAMRRKNIIAKYAAEIRKLNDTGIDVVPGGTTCFDFFLAGKNKGFNVARLIQEKKWNKVDSLYVGDALFPGGNDETVIGVIQTKSVKNPAETFAFIRSELLT